MSRPRTRFRALDGHSDRQIELDWALVEWVLHTARMLASEHVQEWAHTVRIRAWGLPQTASWATVGAWVGRIPTVAEQADEVFRCLGLGAQRMRWQVEDGAGRVVWSARWSQRAHGQRRGRRAVMARQDLVEAGDRTSVDRLADAASRKADASLMEAMSGQMTAFGSTVTQIVESFHERFMGMHQSIEHYQRVGFEQGAHAAYWQMWSNAQTVPSQGKMSEIVALIKELKEAGFSLGGLLKGDPESLLKSWRAAVGGSDESGAPVKGAEIVAGAVGRILIRLTEVEWTALGALIGAEKAATLGTSLSRGLGPEKTAKLAGAALDGLTADQAAILWRALPAETRATLTRAALGSMSPADVAGLTGQLLSSMTQPGLVAVWRALPGDVRARLPLWIASLLSEEEREALIRAWTGGA